VEEERRSLKPFSHTGSEGKGKGGGRRESGRGEHRSSLGITTFIKPEM